MSTKGYFGYWKNIETPGLGFRIPSDAYPYYNTGFFRRIHENPKLFLKKNIKCTTKDDGVGLFTEKMYFFRDDNFFKDVIFCEFSYIFTPTKFYIFNKGITNKLYETDKKNLGVIPLAKVYISIEIAEYDTGWKTIEDLSQAARRFIKIRSLT